MTNGSKVQAAKANGYEAAAKAWAASLRAEAEAVAGLDAQIDALRKEKADAIAQGGWEAERADIAAEIFETLKAGGVSAPTQYGTFVVTTRVTFDLKAAQAAAETDPTVAAALDALGAFITTTVAAPFFRAATGKNGTAK